MTLIGLKVYKLMDSSCGFHGELNVIKMRAKLRTAAGLKQKWHNLKEFHLFCLLFNKSKRRKIYYARLTGINLDEEKKEKLSQ